MRILITADPELPVPPKTYGGIERIVAGLVYKLRQRGHQVGLVAHRESTVATDGFFPWPGKASQRLLDTVKNAWALSQAVKSFRPNVLHSFSRLMYMLPLLPSRLPKIMSYQREPSLRTTALAHRLSRGRLRFTGCSEHICVTGRRAAGTVWNAIPNFVDVEQYTFRATVAADAPLVFLSRVEPIKGAHLAIEAARRAGRRLLVAGNHGDNGENGRYWREQIVPHLGREGIEYVGPVDDRQKNELLGQAAAMIVPVQWEEPFGIVFVESLACGTPVISCPRGALPEIVRSGREGYLCEMVDELTKAVGLLDGIERRDCRLRVEKDYSAEVVVGRYERLYETIASASRSRNKKVRR